MEKIRHQGRMRQDHMERHAEETVLSLIIFYLIFRQGVDKIDFVDAGIGIFVMRRVLSRRSRG